MNTVHNIGMSNGTLNGGIAIGNSSGTVNNTSNTGCISGSRVVKVEGNLGNYSAGDNNSGNMTSTQGSQDPVATRKDPRTLTSSELQDKLRQFECSEETVRSFTDKKINGCVFMTLDDELLKELNVTDSIEKRKLRILLDDFKGQ